MRETEWLTVHGRKLACGWDAWNHDAPAGWLRRRMPDAVAYTYQCYTGLWADVTVRFTDGSVRVVRMTF